MTAGNHASIRARRNRQFDEQWKLLGNADEMVVSEAKQAEKARVSLPH
jgi:hypothetical protein